MAITRECIDLLLNDIRTIRESIMIKPRVSTAKDPEYKIFVKDAETADIFDISNTSAFHYAVMVANVEIMELLIRRGVNVNTKTNQGISPLYTAYMLRNPIVINILRREDAIKINDKWGWYPV
jgi:Ankyrin repeat